MPHATPLDAARAAAAEHLRATGFADEAAIVARGEGDDFAEVRIALSLLRIIGKDASQRPAPRYTRRRSGEEC